MTDETDRGVKKDTCLKLQNQGRELGFMQQARTNRATCEKRNKEQSINYRESI
jgi:hypothetical protein